MQACTQNNGCFAKFPTYDAGYQALLNQINGQAAKGQDLTQFINQYAPPTDNNNTSAYLSTLVSATGATPTTKLTDVIGNAPTSASLETLVTSDPTATDLTASASADATAIDPNLLYIGLGVAALALALFRG